MFKNPCAHRKVFYAISIVLIVVSIFSMVFRGFNYGIDFVSGTTFEYTLPEGFVLDAAMEEDVRDIVLSAKADASVQIQPVGSDGVFIKVTELTNDETGAVIDGLLAYYNGEEAMPEFSFTDATVVVEEVEEATEVVENATEAVVEEETEAEVTGLVKSAINIDKVSASTSDRLIGDTFKAVALAIILMLVYISIRFDFKSGVSAVMALAHDVIIMFGFYSLFQFTVNTSFVAAVLTIIGYSINATIIVFDRIRENNKTMKKASYDERADKAISTSYTRTLYSSLTTLFTIGALYVLGVSSIQEFALPIIVGIVAGAYSSLFIAPTFWAFWKKNSDK